MAKVEQKQTVVEEIKSAIQGASSIVLVDYRGLSVEQDTALRKSLREANVNYKVFKNTMLKFAFEGTDFAQLNPNLEGPSAIAVSYDDATAGPRVLDKMAKDFKNLEFKAGIVEGTYFDAAGVKAVASVPSREVLISKLLGSLQSPISTFARTAKAIADKMEETGVATAASLMVEKAEVAAEAAE
ncbi:50S ribosomal protein L10 [Anaerotalea alkaliphila]|uniref:Large ribosomal subunit protein uL10 n=1 Tax=Anaerotalea alkaliphila TaxID=2662126 RepID=A0A7X5KPQ3_9FIRM|nr:50S ribosomal protein L10 [Anaerotalea alkaliphila]